MDGVHRRTSAAKVDDGPGFAVVEALPQPSESVGIATEMVDFVLGRVRDIALDDDSIHWHAFGLQSLECGRSGGQGIRMPASEPEVRGNDVDPFLSDSRHRPSSPEQRRSANLQAAERTASISFGRRGETSIDAVGTKS